MATAGAFKFAAWEGAGILFISSCNTPRETVGLAIMNLNDLIENDFMLSHVNPTFSLNPTPLLTNLGQWLAECIQFGQTANDWLG